MIITEINNVTKFPVNKKFVQRVVDKCVKFLKFKDVNVELSIAFVSDKEIKKMNKIYRRIDRLTDVLSFGSLKVGIRVRPLKGSDPYSMGKGIGYAEIVISYDTAKKQAKENKVAINQEIEKLLIHGLLHLVGYDHKTGRQMREMEKMEIFLLQKRIK